MIEKFEKTEFILDNRSRNYKTSGFSTENYFNFNILQDLRALKQYYHSMIIISFEFWLLFIKRSKMK